MKTYILTRDDEFVCEGLTLQQAEQICKHFNARYDCFKAECQFGYTYKWDYESRKFIAEDVE
jgi:hypothetical protein